jgi:hypothetical protein
MKYTKLIGNDKTSLHPVHDNNTDNADMGDSVPPPSVFLIDNSSVDPVITVWWSSGMIPS